MHARPIPELEGDGNRQEPCVCLPLWAYQFARDDDDEFIAWRSHQVVLSHDVWIGHGAVLLPGVRIGTGAAIGARAMVSKNVPDFAVAVGVPARVIRFRFAENLRERLLALAWWDWDREKLAATLRDFRRLPIEEFLNKYEGTVG